MDKGSGAATGQGGLVSSIFPLPSFSPPPFLDKKKPTYTNVICPPNSPPHICQPSSSLPQPSPFLLPTPLQNKPDTLVA